MTRGALIYGGSILLHAGVAFALVRIEPPKVHEATTVSVVHTKAKKEKAPEPKTPPPPDPVVAPKAPRVAKRAPVAPPPEAAPAPTAAAEAAPAPSSNVPMFGLTLSGGVGSGPGGIAVPAGNSVRAPQPTTKRAAPKALLAPKHDDLPADDACIEALVKPKPISIEQPKYADRAREAGIEGKVRVELTVDENGEVVDAKVIESLGYGLDEAALEAARKSRFEAATRCGKKTRTTFVIGIRFAL